MKETIRYNTFETNSSSCHSITFSTISGNVNESNKKLEFKGDDFGWEVETYTDPQHKFSYYLVCLLDYIYYRQLNDSKDYYNPPKDEWGYVSFWITDNKEEFDEHNKKCPKDIYFHWIQFLINTIENLVSYFESKGVEFTFYDKNGSKTEFDWFIYELKELNSKKTWKKCSKIPDLIDFGGYIDHQSAPSESSEAESLAKLSEYELFDFVYGNGEVHTDNDNRMCDDI